MCSICCINLLFNLIWLVVMTTNRGQVHQNRCPKKARITVLPSQKSRLWRKPGFPGYPESLDFHTNARSSRNPDSLDEVRIPVQLDIKRVRTSFINTTT